MPPSNPPTINDLLAQRAAAQKEAEYQKLNLAPHQQLFPGQIATTGQIHVAADPYAPDFATGLMAGHASSGLKPKLAFNRTAVQATPQEDRIGTILKGIAALAAELGPDFIHSDEGTKWLNVGETALAILGQIL